LLLVKTWHLLLLKSHAERAVNLEVRNLRLGDVRPVAIRDSLYLAIRVYTYIYIYRK
jgi:hypothetical protein